MARKTSEDIFRQNIPAAKNRESEFYKLLFGAGGVLPAIKIDRGECESFIPPMIEYERIPFISNCYWEKTDEEVYEGSFSYRLTKRSGVGLRAFALLTEREEGLHGLIPGNTYRLSCYVRVQDIYINSIYISIEDSERVTSISPESGFIGDWQRIEVVHTIHEDATFATIGVSTTQEMPEGVEVFFDNFELVAQSAVISSDFDGGSLFNEVELARFFARYFTESLNVIRAQGNDLTFVANRYLNLVRGLINDESDEDYINRFQSLVVSKLNRRRTTRWAVIDALSYFIEPIRIEIIERFDVENNRFRIKFLTFPSEFLAFDATGVVITDQSYLYESYLSGVQFLERPPVNPNINDILLRVKAAGVLVDSSNVDRKRRTIQGGVAYAFGAGVNQPPVSRAGADRSVAAGASVTLDGSTSNDPDGTIETYLWTRTAGTIVALIGEDTAMLSFIAPNRTSDQTMTFRLTVTDDRGGTDTDDVDVEVSARLRLPAQADLNYDWSDSINVTLPEALGGFGDLEYSVTGLPAGATFNPATRVLGGFARVVGNTEVTYTVTDDVTSVERTFDIVTASIQSAVAGNFAGVAGTDRNSLSWEAPVHSGGLPILSYRLESSTDNSTFNTILDSLNRGYLHTGLQSGTLYYYRLYIETGFGDSNFVALQVRTTVVANVPPEARAGSDQTGIAAGATVNLDGSASSDPDGTIDTYAWTQTAGDTVSISGGNTATPSFTAPSTNSAQTLTFQLTVTDDDGATNTDTVDVGVLAEVVANQPPVARAGADQTVSGDGIVVMNGSASSDIDGTIDDYFWDQLSGTSITISGSRTANAAFIAPTETVDDQVLVIRLTVTDNDGATDTDDITITVEGTGAGLHEQTFTVPASTNDRDTATLKRWNSINIDLDNEFAPTGETRFAYRFIATTDAGPDNIELRWLFNASSSGQDLVGAWEDGEMSMTFTQGSDSITLPGPNHSSNTVVDDAETYVWSPPTSQAQDVIDFFFSSLDISQDFQVTLRV